MRRAFTLVELLVVVTIIAVLTGLAVVGLWRSAERLKIGSAARMVVALARYAHSLAASEGREYRLYCDLEEEAVWLAQNMLLGDERDMDDIAGAINKIQRCST